MFLAVIISTCGTIPGPAGAGPADNDHSVGMIPLDFRRPRPSHTIGYYWIAPIKCPDVRPVRRGSIPADGPKSSAGKAGSSLSRYSTATEGKSMEKNILCTVSKDGEVPDSTTCEVVDNTIATTWRSGVYGLVYAWLDLTYKRLA